MRRIGAHVSSSGGIKNAVKNTLDIGGNSIQIFAGSPRMWKRSLYKQKDTQEFINLATKADLFPVFIHALYLTNLASDNPELREKAKQAIITDMANSSAIKSDGVILHIGSHMGRGFEAVKDMIVEEIVEILKSTPEDSYLLLENAAGQKGKIGSPEELSYLIKKIDSPRIGVCIDTAHAFEAGFPIHDSDGLNGYINTLEESFDLSLIKVLHLNDSKTDFESRHDVHENIGEGKIGLENIKRIISHEKLKHLPLILEVPGFDRKGPDKKNIDLVKSLLE